MYKISDSVPAEIPSFVIKRRGLQTLSQILQPLLPTVSKGIFSRAKEACEMQKDKKIREK